MLRTFALKVRCSGEVGCSGALMRLAAAALGLTLYL